MKLEIYENKNGQISSIKVTDKKDLSNIEYNYFIGTKKHYYNISKEKALKISVSFFLNKLQLNKRIEKQLQIQNGKLSRENYINELLRNEVF